MFVLLITVPAVGFALFAILKWFKFPKQKATIYSLVGAIISLLVEIGLIVIHTHKMENKKQKNLIIK